MLDQAHQLAVPTQGVTRLLVIHPVMARPACITIRLLLRGCLPGTLALLHPG